MVPRPPAVSAPSLAALLPPDVVRPFQIEISGLRGRLVRLGPALDAVLDRHAYPEPVARLLGETLVLAALLASALKYDGVFTLQAKGDGAVRQLVVDVTADGALRGHAMADAAALAAVSGDSVPALMGRGHVAFTVDQGDDTERYQGIVDLDGETLWECVQHYFRQSEQIEAGVRSAVARGRSGWRGAGIMIQRLPDPATEAVPMDREDDWRRAMVLLGTCTDAELVDPALDPDRLLFRLFNEDGVRVYAHHPLRFACRCSEARVSAMLAALPEAEVLGLAENGTVEVTCEFCNSRYRFDEARIAALFAA
jgi:molecular chaperone Hsp33